jgi:23S rRNA (cytosine1962-C5)-methyltransferase
MNDKKALSPKNFDDYLLLDSGKGKKLERFGDVVLVRPEQKAIWKRALDSSVWEQANAEFVEGDDAGWQIRDLPDKRWKLNFSGLKFWCEIERSKQVGVFPENSAQWSWIARQIEGAAQKPRVLNLFGYTGVASLAAAKAGADVTHIDSSRRAIGLGKEGQQLSNLDSAQIRWISEDAGRFVEREIKRGNKYEGLILDPPMFGLGPRKERWEFFKDFLPFCELLKDVLSKKPLFVVITAYAKDMDPDMIREGIRRLRLRSGQEDYGELVLQEKSAGRRISMSYYGHWSAK